MDINEILGRNINSIKELKAAMNELKDSLIGVDASSEEYKATSEKLAAAQAELNKVTRAGKDDNDAAADSIRGLEKQYKALYDQYKMLTEEQRNSDFGKNMAESLETLSNKINDAKKEVGNFTNNIGRYAQGATEAFSKMGVSLGALQQPMRLAAGGAKTLGAALKSLIANPVGAAIMAIVVAFKALHAIAERVKKAIKDNEETSNRLKVAMATFKPVVDAVTNAFDFLAKVVVKTVEALAKVAEKIMSVIPGMRKAIQSHKDLAKATNELTKAQREANVENSKKQAEIERLREEASATDDVIEKRQKLQEAKALQAEVDAKNVELAREELRIMEEYAAKTANSAEENEKLAAAQKKVNDAIAQGEKNQRLYNKQLAATETKTKTATSAAVDYKKKAKELYDQIVEDSKDEITKLTEKYEKEKKLLEKYHYDTKLLTKKYEKEVAEIRMNEWKQQRAKETEAWDNWYDNVSRYYKNLQDLNAGDKVAMNKATDDFLNAAKEELNAFREIADEYSHTAEEGMNKMMNVILSGADLTKVTDFNYIKDFLEQNVDDADFDQVMNLFYTFGEESWVMFVDGLEKKAKELNVTYGLDIKNMPDAEARAVKLGEDIAENIGEGINKVIDKLVEDKEVELYEQVKESILNGEDISEINNKIAEYNYQMLEDEWMTLQQSLDAFSGAQEQKLTILKQFYDVESQLQEAELKATELQAERTKAIWDAAFESFEGLTSSLNSVFDAITNVMQAEVDSGRLTEREAKRKEKAIKRLEAIQLAVSIAGIAASTAAGIMDVWRGYAAELPVNAETAAATGPAAAVTKAALDAKSLTAAIIRTATIGTQGAAQIAAAVGGYIAKSQASASDGGGGGSVGVGASPTLIDSTPYTYTRTVQTTEEEDQMNQPIYVTVTDIEEGLGHRAKVTNEVSF